MSSKFPEGSPQSKSQPEVTPKIQPQVQPQVQPQTQPQPQPEVQATLRRLPSWRFWLPLLFQVGLIVSVPAQDAYTYATGRQITLQTAPVDPYDLLRGHYQTLSYEISRPDQLKQLPGSEKFNDYQYSPHQFYLVLEAPADNASTATNAQPPQPWKPIRISADRPTDLADNQVAIQGHTNRYGNITYGLETYYMPEAQRNQLNQEISQQQNQRAFVVEVKVDHTGNAVPVSLWVGKQNYRF